jgi:hypothetical protein
VRKEEFLALKQGPLSVSEYRDKFLQLLCYAPEDVNTYAQEAVSFSERFSWPPSLPADEPHLPHLPAFDR